MVAYGEVAKGYRRHIVLREVGVLGNKDFYEFEAIWDFEVYWVF